jgi:hypothetical protein
MRVKNIARTPVWVGERCFRTENVRLVNTFRQCHWLGHRLEVLNIQAPHHVPRPIGPEDISRRRYRTADWQGSALFQDQSLQRVFLHFHGLTMH